MIDPNDQNFLNRHPNFQHEIYDIGDFTYGGLKILSWGKGFKGRLKIGKFCSIAEEVQILLCNEHNVNWVSTYPFGEIFGQGTPGHPKTKGDIIIGNDVWIGRGAMILSGVTIGDGAVIGARTVVAKDVSPYAIVVGNPAICIKFRFTYEQIKSLLKIRWWDWNYEKISRFVPLLEGDNIDKFIEGAKNEFDRNEGVA